MAVRLMWTFRVRQAPNKGGQRELFERLVVHMHMNISWCFLGDGDGRAHLLVAFVIWSLSTHPVRDGATLLRLFESPPTWGAVFTFCHTLRENRLLVLSRSCLTSYGHH